MVSQPMTETVNTVSTTTAVGVSGSLLLGFSSEQWVLMLTALTVVGNLILMGFKLVDAIRSRFFNKED